MQNLEFQTGVIRPVECVKEGWQLIKSDYWLLFAIVLVGALIGGATMYVLFGAMICGIYLCYLKVIDGEQPLQFDLLFKGFGFFFPGLIVMLVIVVPMIAVYVIIYLPFIAAAVLGEQMTEEQIVTMLIGAGLIDLIFVIVMVCFHTLLMFSFPLIVDRNLGAFDAMKTSARAVWKNMSGVVGLILVNMGLSIAGQLALCIGIYFVIPVMMAANVVAYRKVFPKLRPSNFTPPPPNAYLDL
jgi:uncharacterized membrane protein